MILKDIVDEDFVQYKKPSMFIIFPYCSFKCDIESKCNICQNSSLIKLNNIDISIDTIVDRYINNKITSSIVCGGLEPFDSWNDLLELIHKFRQKTKDDIVIYTGYYENEISDYLPILHSYKNVIIKFGRFIPNKPHIFDTILGVELSSDNQYSKII